MLGFDPLTIGSLLVLAQAQGCVAPKPAEINVRPQTAEVQIISRYPLASLQNMQMDTVNPHSFGSTSIIQGFMGGKIGMRPQVKMNYSQDPRSGTYCIWYEAINIDITIDPKIYIGREVYQNPCERKATLDHEMKHVEADRRIVNKYGAIMGQKVLDGLKERGFTAGPVPAEKAQETVDRMQKTVFQLVEHEYKKMELERIDIQRAIDTKAEYDRVQALCP